MTIRLLIADDHDWVREGLRLVFEPTEIEVVDEGTSSEEAVSLALGLDIDVVLLDISMPDGSGVEAFKRIKTAKPDLPVLMYTSHKQVDHRFHCREAGAAGYVIKGCFNQELIGAIRLVHAGMNLWPTEQIRSFSPR